MITLTWHVALKLSKLRPGKKKMINIAKNILMVGQDSDGYFATEALCRHMRWPLAYGGKVKDGCVTCPLHQTTHHIQDGSLVDWSPFPLFPPYGKLVGKMSKKKDLKIYDTRVKNGNLEVRIV